MKLGLRFTAIFLAIGICTFVAGIMLWLYFRCRNPLFESESNHFRGGRPVPTTPSMSADGLSLICDSIGAETGHVFRVSRDGQRAVPLTPSGGVEFHPVYSPDGAMIAFTKEVAGYRHVWLMDSSGSNLVQLTHGKVLDEVHTFSDDGTRLYCFRTDWCNRYRLPRREIFEVTMVGRKQSTIMRIGAAMAISPNGEWLLSQNANPKDNEVWLRNRTSGATRYVGKGSSASFSSDSTKIVWLVLTSDYRHNVSVMNIDGSGRRRIPCASGFKTRPAFCLHDRAILFRIETSQRDGPGGVYVVMLDSNHEDRLPLTIRSKILEPKALE